MHMYRKKAVIFLMIMLLIFSSLFILSLVDLKRGRAVFQLGLGFRAENIAVMVFSLLAMVRVVIELYGIEHHHEYEARIKRHA